MANASSATAAPAIMAERMPRDLEAAPGVTLRGLTKIFGPNPRGALDKLRRGELDKQALLENHGAVLALNDIDLDAQPGRIFVVMGLSGSGKSTLVRHINRLIEPTAGEVAVNGRDILKLNRAELRRFRRHEVAMVFQGFGLMPHKTVGGNVGYGLRLRGMAAEKRRERTAHWISRVGLEGYEARYPDELSGGMQQRVGLARALASDAGLILMDEPFGALDPLIRADMQAMLLELQAELGKTIIFITHDLEEAVRLGDDLAILRDGVIAQQGEAQHVVLNPADDYVAAFVRNINRGRVIRLSSVMHKPGKASARLKLDQRMVLEDALATLAGAKTSSAAIVDGADKVVGSISLRDIAAALAPPADQR